MEYLVAALLSGFLLFNSQATPGKAERMMEKALRRQFPAAQVDVNVEGKRGFDVLNGRFKSVVVNLKGFGRINGLPLTAAPAARKAGHIGRLELRLRDFIFDDLKVDAADFMFNDVTYDVDALKEHSVVQIVQSGPAAVHLVVPAAALETLLGARFKDIENARVSAQDGQVRLTGKRAVPVVRVSIPFTLTATPKIRNGNEVWLTDPRVAVENVTGITLPAGRLLSALNPVYVFDPQQRMPFRIRGTGVQAHDNTLELTADLTFVPVGQTTTGGS
ncbi:MAG: DUF2993 domain-containing protein [Armatimonadota bacterium]|nr:DUF2993 domain-containing protein [Armatimonadota bacterium]